MLHEEFMVVLNDRHITHQQVAKQLEMRLKAIQTSADSLITNNYFPCAPKVCPKFYYFEYCADQKTENAIYSTSVQPKKPNTPLQTVPT